MGEDQLTNAELTILGLVAEAPRHGYELEQIIEQRGVRDWTEIGFSSIYYLLKKLERKGLVQGATEAGARGPRRRAYRITPDGRRSLRRGVLAALSDPEACKPRILLGLANLPTVSRREARQALQRYRQLLQERQAHLGSVLQSMKGAPPFVEAMFDYSLTMVAAELQWADRFLRRLATEEPARPRPSS